MYGKVQEVPQNGNDAVLPAQPYGCAKVYAYWITVNYREVVRPARQQRHPVQPRITAPGETFVTRKITRAVAHILAGLQKKLYLGNLDAKRDWGYARNTWKACG